MTAVFMHVMRRSSTPMVEFAERYELSFTQLKAVFALVNAAAPMPISRLAECNGASLPATGRAIDGLLHNGLVSREEDPTDRRVKLVQITELGEQAVRKIYESRAQILKDLLSELGPAELKSLETAVAPLRELIERNASEGQF